ncbi:type II toxin-antitoxin system CcdA family antitoxin [Pseudomonas sp. J452]|uniref:type II toxin-antitoxin system CcdA family antitoxin n=1 Tax=Pseudomonas sp. J452 TaxID=2898441 RepID=UPI0021ADFE7A|nr:type II toxin-antitoxin system CcdA family antitoxin [Pseudomonas sp. J452]UUY07735.1 type II toxin-antitoxin system CcdA family antitoxin [Pseudomonas sp. J452]
MTYKTGAPNQNVHLIVSGDLLGRTSEAGINLSLTLEQALVQAIQVRRGEIWLAENRETLVGYNKHTDEHGVFSDGFRCF